MGTSACSPTFIEDEFRLEAREVRCLQPTGDLPGHAECGESPDASEHAAALAQRVDEKDEMLRRDKAMANTLLTVMESVKVIAEDVAATRAVVTAEASDSGASASSGTEVAFTARRLTRDAFQLIKLVALRVTPLGTLRLARKVVVAKLTLHVLTTAWLWVAAVLSNATSFDIDLTFACDSLGRALYWLAVFRYGSGGARNPQQSLLSGFGTSPQRLLECLPRDMAGFKQTLQNSNLTETVKAVEDTRSIWGELAEKQPQVYRRAWTILLDMSDALGMDEHARASAIRGVLVQHGVLTDVLVGKLNKLWSLPVRWEP